MNALFINEGATCITCIYQEGALRKELDSVRQCKKCLGKNSRPGWDPKPSIKLSFGQAMVNGRIRTVRRAIP